MEQLRRKLMHILSEETTTSINQLAELDAKCINLAFHVSQVIGLAQLSSTITDYSNFLFKKHGNIILSSCSEYRVYIVHLLQNINDDFKSSVISELINPQVKRITSKELFEILNITPPNIMAEMK